MLGRDEIDRYESEVVVHKVLAADSSYLDDHRVAGIAALPGTFYAEMAAEAAQFLEPGRAVVGLEDLVFSSFLKVHSGRPVTARTRAQLLARDDRRSRVRVSVTTDVFAPDGRPLVSERKHFEGIVQLATEPPVPPTWQPWPGDDLAPATDAYYVRNPAIHLGGIFVAGRDHRLHPHGNRATLDPRPAAAEPDLRGFLLPAVALAALLRVGVLDSRPDGCQALAVPTSIERVSLYLSADDCELALRHPRVDLYSMTPYDDQNSVRPTNCAIAATPGGHVVIRVENMSCAVVGYINPGTGEYRPSPRLSQVRAAAAPAS